MSLGCEPIERLTYVGENLQEYNVHNVMQERKHVKYRVYNEESFCKFKVSLDRNNEMMSTS